jgi:GWxTD domain-containing protein
VSKKIGVVEFPVDIPDFRRFEFFLSDIELAYEIQQIEAENEAAVNGRLMKENRLVIPNPGRVFQAYQDSVINIYCELYGLSLDENGEDEFIIEYKVKDATGSIVRDFGQMTYPRPGSTAVLSHTLNIRGLNPGEYYLTLRAIDPITYKEALSVKSFSLFDPISQVVVSGEEVDELANIAWYHLSEAEKIQIRKLTKQGQVNFLEQFWREMDDDPTTPENPKYKEAVRRFLYANEYFSTRGDIRDGWKTDRGRIYITYGPYDDKTDIALPGASMPLIKWEYYSLENGVIFIFSSEDVAGASDFRLVHSTHPHEIHDPTWVEKLEQESPEDNLQRQGDDFGW